MHKMFWLITSENNLLCESLGTCTVIDWNINQNPLTWNFNNIVWTQNYIAECISDIPTNDDASCTQLFTVTWLTPTPPPIDWYCILDTPKDATEKLDCKVH
jgi:hypothetical protein